MCTMAFTVVSFSCSSFEPIDYNISVAKEEETKEAEFSFTKNENFATSKVLTKKDKDRLANEKIKTLLASSKRVPIKTKGVYFPAYVLGDKKQFDLILNNISDSNINTIVVDIKDDAGQITAELDSDLIKSYKTTNVKIENIADTMKILKEKNIYVIARVASFRDSLLAKKNNELAIMTKFGFLYKDDQKYSWLNPYKKETWNYLLEIGKACKKAGFDEVQYDYFRFSTDKGMQSVVFDDKLTEGKSKSDILIECCQYLYENLIPEEIFVSIDVFGSIISSYRDQESVGQNYVDLLKYCDYICPMLYPSHYSSGYYGVQNPDLEPYTIVKSALNASKSAIANNYNSTFHYGSVRPWLQGFTADYIETYQKYTSKQYREQIKAVEDAGYDEWLFWNAAGNYQWDAFK